VPIIESHLDESLLFYSPYVSMLQYSSVWFSIASIISISVRFVHIRMGSTHTELIILNYTTRITGMNYLAIDAGRGDSRCCIS
jgi:hypothetical protein